MHVVIHAVGRRTDAASRHGSVVKRRAGRPGQFYSAPNRPSSRHSGGKTTPRPGRRRLGSARLEAGPGPSLPPSLLPPVVHLSPGQLLQPGAALADTAVNQTAFVAPPPCVTPITLAN